MARARIQRFFGWVPSLPDIRDHLYTVPKEVAAAELPAWVDNTYPDPGPPFSPVFDQGALGSCFPAGTLIRMADGTERRIEDVRLLDSVLTAEGNIGHVKQTMVRMETDSIIHLQVWGHHHLHLTEEHPVLTRRGYVRAGKLRLDDWVAMPRYLPACGKVIQTALHVSVRQSVRQTRRIRYAGLPGRKGLIALVKPLPDAIELTPGFGRVIGLFLSEGNTSKTKVTWTFGAHEEETLAAELIRLLQTELGVEGCLKKRPSKAIKVEVYGTAWAMLFEGLCSTGAGSKRLHPDLAVGPADFLDAVLQGWLDGDGCHDETGWKGTTISRELAMSMFDIAQALGRRPALKHTLPRASHGIKERQPRWDVSLRAKDDNWRVQQEERHVWRKVRGIVKEEFKGWVYNLEVEGDNSYVAEGIGVHNCGPNSSAGGLTFEEVEEEGKQDTMPSRLFIYYCTRYIMGTVNQDSGVQNRDMLKALNKYGWCDEALWPYDPARFKIKPPTECFQQAGKRRISEYKAVSQDLAIIKGCLAARNTFILGFTVYDSMMTAAVEKSGDIPLPSRSDKVAGGHDVLAVGYDEGKDTIKIRNSWGSSWGQNGYGTLPFAYVTNARLAGDFWTITYSGKEPATPPDPPPDDGAVEVEIPQAGTYRLV